MSEIIFASSDPAESRRISRRVEEGERNTALDGRYLNFADATRISVSTAALFARFAEALD